MKSKFKRFVDFVYQITYNIYTFISFRHESRVFQSFKNKKRIYNYHLLVSKYVMVDFIAGNDLCQPQIKI